MKTTSCSHDPNMHIIHGPPRKCSNPLSLSLSLTCYVKNKTGLQQINIFGSFFLLVKKLPLR